MSMALIRYRPIVTKPLLAILLLLASPARLGAAQEDGKAAAVVKAAVEALGGARFLAVKNIVSEGRYFFYKAGRKGFTSFFDWTVYEEPVKSRFQFGKGKRAEVTVHNLQLNKGWVKEGPFDRKELTEKQIEDFRRQIKGDLGYLLRNRRNEDGQSMFYYGPGEISGEGDLEAVEFIDKTNNTVTVYFDRESHFPTKVESHFTDGLGLGHKREVEFYNWHEIDGVQLALRTDAHVDGELAEQTFIEVIRVNDAIPEEHFLEPPVKVQKKKKKKKN